MNNMLLPVQDSDLPEAAAQKPPSRRANETRNQLSPEQADFVNDLYNLNVSAPAIALVMDRMMRRPEVADGRGGNVTSTTPEPPHYTP